MPRNLTANQSFENVQQWIIEHKKSFSIVPVRDNLRQIPETKGIYFWFMHPDAYVPLSIHLPVSATEPRIEIEGYQLVYLGTAGVRNNRFDNRSNLYDRICWHVYKNTSENCVLNGTMSTFRRTLGALLSNDLFQSDPGPTQELINNLFSSYFRLYFIEYPGSFLEVKNAVNSDEGVLIEKIRPIFNLRGNKNCQLRNHITRSIQARRRLVEKSTKQRLQIRNGEPTANKSVKTKVNSINVNRRSNMSVQIDFQGVQYTISIEGNRTIVRDRDNREVLLNKKDLFRRFISDNQLQIGDKDTTTMEYARGIIRHFRGGSSGEKTLTTAPNGVRPPVPPKYEVEMLTPEVGGMKWRFIVPCSNAKIKESKLSAIGVPSNLQSLSFDMELREYREKILLAYNARRTLQRLPPVNFEITAPAYQVYSRGRLYSAAGSFNWNACESSKVYITSALFGIIKPTDYIPLYDLAMSDILNGQRISNFWRNELDSIVIDLTGDYHIVDLLSNDYRAAIPASAHLLYNSGVSWSDKWGNHKGRWLSQQLNQLCDNDDPLLAVESNEVLQSV